MYVYYQYPYTYIYICSSINCKMKRQSCRTVSCINTRNASTNIYIYMYIYNLMMTTTHANAKYSRSYWFVLEKSHFKHILSLYIFLQLLHYLLLFYTFFCLLSIDSLFTCVQMTMQCLIVGIPLIIRYK